VFSPNLARDAFDIAGNKLANKPVYILASAKTISAAEDLLDVICLSQIP
jgi:hypothetical protein